MKLWNELKLKADSETKNNMKKVERMSDSEKKEVYRNYQKAPKEEKDSLESLVQTICTWFNLR